MKKAYKRPCLFCGKIFGGGRGLHKRVKFCSRKCYQESGFHSNFMKSHPNVGQKNVGIKNRKKVFCKICKKEFEVIVCSKQKYCSSKCYRKDISNLLRGVPKSKEHNKKVGEALKRYYDIKGRIKHKRSYHNTSREYVEWRKKVFERDDYTCQRCKGLGFIQAHHIKSWVKYPEERYNINNGTTLCLKCHQSAHSKRKGDASEVLLCQEAQASFSKGGSPLQSPVGSSGL